MCAERRRRTASSPISKLRTSAAADGRLRSRRKFSGRSAMDLFGRCVGLGDSFDLTITGFAGGAQGRHRAWTTCSVSTVKDSYYIRRVRAALTQSFGKDFKIDVRDQAREASGAAAPGILVQTGADRFRFDRRARHAGRAGAGGGIQVSGQIGAQGAARTANRVGNCFARAPFCAISDSMQPVQHWHHRSGQRRRGHAGHPRGKRARHRAEAGFPAARCARCAAAASPPRPFRPRSAPRCKTANWREVVDHPDVDIVAELVGGTGVAREIMEAAIARGKSVVTANKELMALAGAELWDRAIAARINLAMEASVAGGIPIHAVLREGISGDRINTLYGILNGTCNYILTEIETPRRRLRPKCSPKRSRPATPKPILPPMSTASTRAPSWRSWRRSRSASASFPPTSTPKASAASRPSISNTRTSCITPSGWSARRGRRPTA